MGAPDTIWTTGPTGGVAATILAIGSAFLLIAWKALPLFREWAAAVAEVRGIGHRAAARLDDLIEDHGRLRQDVARLLHLLNPDPERGEAMTQPTHAADHRAPDQAAVAHLVRQQLNLEPAGPGSPPVAGASLDLQRILGILGSVDQVVAKLYPILAPLLPPDAAAAAAVLVRVLRALADHPAVAATPGGPGGP